MPSKARQAELKDLKDKVRSASEAARRPDAGEREKADLKLLEQEAAAAKLRAERSSATDKRAGDKPAETVDAKLDKALQDSFPGSDPVSFVEAAPLNEDDEDLDSVQDKAKER